MPCEGCHMQFTVFRRKRVCGDCKRFYCKSCLITKNSIAPWNSTLCERCAIFAKRPLLRTDLLKLKPKDLIFYLQSKHISTAGCVEKDELIGLVLTHAQQSDNNDKKENKYSNADSSNSFNNIKQTCQNFFINITENLSDSFATTFDTKSSSNSSQNDQDTHIFNQPRVSTREMPTYASHQTPSQSGQHTMVTNPSSSSSDSSQNPTQLISDRSSEITSPINSLSSANVQIQEAATNSTRGSCETSKCQCDYCSDDEDDIGDNDDDDDDSDEIIASYSKQMSSKCVKTKYPEEVEILPGTSQSKPILATNTSINTQNTEKEIVVEDEDRTSQSSFEELGAIGGISDDSKTTTRTLTTDTNSCSLEQWQILDAQKPEDIYESKREGVQMDVKEENSDVQINKNTNKNIPQTDEMPSSSVQDTSIKTKKLTRRRSESFLKRHAVISDDDSPTHNTHTSPILTDKLSVSAITAHFTSRSNTMGNCKRCGKRKLNIRRQVEKMRKHLESSQMSEADIKHELSEFLAYLEMRTKSFDHSDSETPVSHTSGLGQQQQQPLPQEQGEVIPPLYLSDMESSEADAMMTAAMLASMAEQAGLFNDLDYEEGINVYPTPSSYQNGKDNRFTQLQDYKSFEELENLSVKQLKEILMLNRVDFKGCCEKQELLERVERLWNTFKSTPAIEKLDSEELCKICMDAPIECVILECGHMATCTNCGKVLSECPICRQYIVRVVRFFRA